MDKHKLDNSQLKEQRLARWYFGGLSSGMAACFTHPLDLIKVHLQTQEGRVNIVQSTVNVIKNHGILALYNGLSASLLRQMTYSTTRFGVYEVMKQRMTTSGEQLPFYKKVLLASMSGTIGGFMGTPADMVNVRMQNDVKLPPESRRNYKHALDGLWQVYKKEGAKRLFSGAITATCRGFLMTVGQISMYDQIKQTLLVTPYFSDNLTTHFTASSLAGAIATTMTQPLDVLKTRMMNAKPGEYKGVLHCIALTAKQGPLAFFKGYVPAFVRIGPHTILTFIFLEQLRQRFGFLPSQK